MPFPPLLQLSITYADGSVYQLTAGAVRPDGMHPIDFGDEYFQALLSAEDVAQLWRSASSWKP